MLVPNIMSDVMGINTEIWLRGPVVLLPCKVHFLVMVMVISMVMAMVMVSRNIVGGNPLALFVLSAALSGFQN